MANKVPWYHTFDWRAVSGLLLLLLVSAVFILTYKLPEIIRNDRLRNYNGETVGYITDVKENTQFLQTSEGNKTEVRSFTLSYSFRVNHQTYNSRDELKFSPVNKLNLNKCLNQDSGKVKIKYRPDDPTHSLIAWE